jgi:hypothetical protein
MVKAASSNQLAFGFEPPKPAAHPAALAGADARIARMVGEALNSDGRAREVVAAEMGVLLAEDVSKASLDAWSAPGKGGHNISFARMLALIAVTKRFDLLDREMRTIGAAVLVGEELHTARLGHIKTRMDELKREMRELERMAQPIGRGRDEC